MTDSVIDDWELTNQTGCVIRGVVEGVETTLTRGATGAWHSHDWIGGRVWFRSHEIQVVEIISKRHPVEASEAEVTAALDSWYAEALKGAHDQLRADVYEHARDRMRAALNAARAVQP